MKKYYVALTILATLIGYLAKTNYWFEDERDIYFPITKEQLKVKKSFATDQGKPQKDPLQLNDFLKPDQAAPTTNGLQAIAMSWPQPQEQLWALYTDHGAPFLQCP